MAINTTKKGSEFEIIFLDWLTEQIGSGNGKLPLFPKANSEIFHKKKYKSNASGREIETQISYILTNNYVTKLHIL